MPWMVALNFLRDETTPEHVPPRAYLKFNEDGSSAMGGPKDATCFTTRQEAESQIILTCAKAAHLIGMLSVVKREGQCT